MKSAGDMGNDLLHGLLLAIQDLRRKYSGQKMITEYAPESDDGNRHCQCPLCIVNMKLGRDDCDYCPWSFLENRDSCHAPGGYRDQDAAQKLSRLDRWEAAINDELAKRTP